LCSASHDTFDAIEGFGGPVPRAEVPYLNVCHVSDRQN
jgi:hypothetical protein